jgi:hypothetical protein
MRYHDEKKTCPPITMMNNCDPDLFVSARIST